MIEVKSIHSQEITVAVSGRLTAGIVPAVQDELFRLIDDHPGILLTLDADGLDYITSTGLRMLLKIEKRDDVRFRLINVSDEVFNILTLTGFDKILTIEKKIRTISLEGCELIGAGTNGKVYKLNEDTVVKVFTGPTALETIERESRMAQKALVAGIPTPISFSNIVRCGEYPGIMFEMLNSDSLGKVLVEQPENFEAYMRKYVDLLEKLHTTQVQETEFPSEKKLYREYIEESRSWYTPQEYDILLRLLDSIPERNTLVHGDFQTRNIMVQDDELILIDMGDLAYGHPVFDLMAMCACQANLVKLSPQLAESLNGMPCDLIMKNWFRSLELYFKTEDPERVRYISDTIILLTKLRNAITPALAKGISGGIIEASVNEAKVSLIPRIDEAIRGLEIFENEGCK